MNWPATIRPQLHDAFVRHATWLAVAELGAQRTHVFHPINFSADVYTEVAKLSWVELSSCAANKPLHRRCERTKVRMTLREVVSIATAAAIYSLGHGLRTFSAVPLDGKWVSAYWLSNNLTMAMMDVDGSCQPNPTHYKWKNLDPNRPNQILSNRALNALT